MRALKILHSVRLLAIEIFVFVLCGSLGPAGASGASLAIWTVDEQQYIHDLAIVEKIDFTDDELQVVTVYYTHQYSLEAIVRMDFLDYPTNVEDPEEAADIVKVVYTGSVESFMEVVDGCPVPVVIAGGAKMGSDEEIFRMVEDALKAGAAGVSIGRNAFQHKNPTKMVQALSKMVHEGVSVEEAINMLKE